MLWQVSLMAKNFEKNGGKILDRNFRAVTLHPKSVADDMSACLTHTRCVLLACMRAGVSRFIGENDVLVGAVALPLPSCVRPSQSETKNMLNTCRDKSSSCPPLPAVRTLA